MKHRIPGQALLLHGDALALMPRIKHVDFIFTDPPYGHNNNDNDLIRRRERALKKYKKQDVARPIMNDDYVQANQLFLSALKQWRTMLPPGGWLCCCCGGGGGPKGIQFVRWIRAISKRLQFEQAIVWDKGPLGMGWRYRRSYEFVLTAYRKGEKARWFDQAHNIENIIRPGDYGIRKIEPGDDQHPTEKPVELAAHFIRLHTQPGDVVLDPFMGRGSTGVAAISLQRKFIGIELDPHWYAEAVARLDHTTQHHYDLPIAAKGAAKTTKQLSDKGMWKFAKKHRVKQKARRNRRSAE